MIFSAKRQFFARFSNCSNSLNFKAKINFKTTRQNDLKWRKTCTGLKFDLEHFNGPQTKFIGDSLYKHPVFTHSRLSFYPPPALFHCAETNRKVSLLLLSTYRVPQKYRLKVYGSEGHKNGANQILILCMFFSTSGHLF